MSAKKGWPVGSGQMAARTRRVCSVCGLHIRPCNMERHLVAHLSAAVDDALAARSPSRTERGQDD